MPSLAPNVGLTFKKRYLNVMNVMGVRWMLFWRGVSAGWRRLWLSKIDQEVIFDGDWGYFDESFDVLVFCRAVNDTWIDQLIIKSNFFHKIIFYKRPILVNNDFVKSIVCDVMICKLDIYTLDR